MTKKISNKDIKENKPLYFNVGMPAATQEFLCWEWGSIFTSGFNSKDKQSMHIKHGDLEIDQVNPFESCKLDRKQYANVLTSIVSNYADGFVLAINNEWGTGKTTFVKMWQQDLSNQGFKTLYFNAWENDFESNPLVAILAELKTLTGDKNKTTFKELLKIGAVLIKNVAPALAKGFAGNYIVTKVFSEEIENITKAATDILEKEVETYASRKTSLIEFREKLAQYLKQTESDKPVVFIIDELDRCRPNYAVEVLEQMKHFFAVSGIVFVLAIDKTQLGHAIRGVYGSEQLNADEYLRRFIDIEYTIPAPLTKHFVNYLFDHFAFDDFFKSPEKLKYGSATTDRSSFISTVALLFDKKKPTLRQQEKIFAHVRLVLKTFDYNTFLFPDLLFFLTYCKVLNNEFYRNVERREYAIQELCDAFYLMIPKGLSSNEKRNFLFVQAHLVNLYNNATDMSQKKELIQKLESGKIEAIVTSKLDESEDNTDFKEILKRVSTSDERAYTSIEHLIDKINLLDPIIT